MNDADLYTGVDKEPKGVFENEVKNEEVQAKITEQREMLSRITPKIEGLIELVDAEILNATSIDRFITATNEKEVDIRAELQATALYKKYLESFKAMLVLNLNEAKKK